MWESLARVNAVVGGVVWGPVGLALLFGTGCLLTVRTGFFQLRYFGYWMRHTIGAIFLDRNVTAHTNDEAISQFQSLCTALAATIGTGNIVGVAAAILAGGPGAVFWMWVMALLGMMTSYHPACFTTLPFTVNSTPAHSAVTAVTSLTHFSENASIIRPAII